MCNSSVPAVWLPATGQHVHLSLQWGQTASGVQLIKRPSFLYASQTSLNPPPPASDLPPPCRRRLGRLTWLQHEWRVTDDQERDALIGGTGWTDYVFCEVISNVWEFYSNDQQIMNRVCNWTRALWWYMSLVHLEEKKKAQCEGVKGH